MPGMDESDWKDRRDEIAAWLEYDCSLPRKQAEYAANRALGLERGYYRKRELDEKSGAAKTGA